MARENLPPVIFVESKHPFIAWQIMSKQTISLVSLTAVRSVARLLGEFMDCDNIKPDAI